MRKFMFFLNLAALLCFVGVVLSNFDDIRSGGWVIIFLVGAYAFANLFASSALMDAKEDSWLSLWIRRKKAEEKAKLQALEK